MQNEKNNIVAFGIIVVCLVFQSCDNIPNQQTSPRVFIRSGGQTVTSYELDSNGQIQKATSINSTTNTIVRDFTEQGNSRSMTAVSQDGQNISVTSELNAQGLVTRRNILQSNGALTELNLEYFYKNNGALDGVIQRDANGNIQSKASDQ